MSKSQTIAETAIMATPTAFMQMRFSVYLDDYRKAIEDDDIVAERKAQSDLWDFVLELWGNNDERLAAD